MKRRFWQLGDFLLIVLILISSIGGAYSFPLPLDHVEATMGDNGSTTDRYSFQNIPPEKEAFLEKDTEDQQEDAFSFGKSPDGQRYFCFSGKLPYNRARSHKQGEQFQRLFLLFHCLKIAHS